MLDLVNVSLNYGANAVVQDVSFHVEDGEIVCLLGPSGCGKTSLLRLIAGLETPNSGIISIDEKIASSKKFLMPPHKRNVGLLFQDFALFPHLTVAQNISYGLKSLTRLDARKRTADLLRQIQLSSHSDKYPHMLSGGEQQRVAIARARAPHPKILLLDEPFSALDSSLREQLRDETMQIIRDHGITAIFVTHDPEEALTTADRIVLMNRGAVVQSGKPNDLFQKPANAFCASYFGKINYIDGVVDGGAIRTDIGCLDNTTFSDGSAVHVLLRPEALQISPDREIDHSSRELRVCNVRYAGHSCLIRFGVGVDPDFNSHIEVRHIGALNIKPGDKLRVKMDPTQAFIFKK